MNDVIIADLGVRRFDIEPLAGSNCELVGDLVEAQAPLGKLRAPLWKLRLPCGGADILLGTQDTGYGNPWLPLGSLGCPWETCSKLGHSFVEITVVSSGQEPQISSNPRKTRLLHMKNEN